MAEDKKNVFETLSKVNISDHVKQKMGLDYLSWSWAWSKLKSIYPDTPVPKPTLYQEMLITKQGYELTDRQVPYLTTPTGTMVQVTVVIKGEPYTQSLYVMDNRNNAVINPSQSLIYKTTQRCIVKAIAMAGLGLNLYANEDLPMGDINSNDQQQAEQKVKQQKNATELAKAREEYRKLKDEAVKKMNISAKELNDSVLSAKNSKYSKQRLAKMSQLENAKIMTDLLKNFVDHYEDTPQLEEAN